MTRRVVDTINKDLVLGEFFQLNKDIIWTDSLQGKQTGLQYKEGEDYWTSAVGKCRGNELEYTNLNPFFKNTIFEMLINKYNLKRTRLMWVNPKSCYSFHADTTPRIHIPLITNTECYFLFKTGAPFHLNAKLVWWVDTTMCHTFLNCSDQSRLHLVGIVEK
jgi:hypothetical protein